MAWVLSKFKEELKCPACVTEMTYPAVRDQYSISHLLWNDTSFVVQSLSRVQFFVTPWTAACQASQFFAISQSLLRLMSIELVMPSNHLILCCSLLLQPSIFPSIRVFSKSQFFASGGQSIGVSASASVLPMTIQD